MNRNDVQQGRSVYHARHPGRLGVLTGRILDALFPMAEVHWGGQFEFLDLTQLALFDPAAQRDADALVRNRTYGTLDDLRRRVTFEKLRGALTDVFYSMKASEIDFYPHQFKPVLRFIESPTNRLLIADEVGLGKTIESGLIWTEWQAREKARRLLVVCTPTLCPKWIRELQERFQLPAEPADASRLVQLMNRFQQQGPGLSFVAVTTYHSLRPFREERRLLDELREAGSGELESRRAGLPARVQLLSRLERWDAAQPLFDMVVFDEATAMKNTASASYAAGEVLSASAGATLCLSATPVHNQSRDLYALLRLIDPDVFRDQAAFEELRLRNLPVVRLQNLLSQQHWRSDEANALLEGLPSAEARRAIQPALAAFDGSPERRVELRHRVERLNLLSGFVNRTRKRDIIADRVIRQPVTLPVGLEPAEAALYQAVLALVRNEVRQRGDQVTTFHLIHPALRMASCLPVVAADVRAGRWGGFEELAGMSDDPDEDWSAGVCEEIPELPDLGRLSDFDFERHDSKYAAFHSVLRLITQDNQVRSDKGDVIEVGPHEKVIVFAFFKATIAYLQRRLEADGFRAVALTGDIKDRNERPSGQARIGSTGQSLALAVTSNERKQVAPASLAEATRAASKVSIVSLQPYRANSSSQSRRNRFQFTGGWYPRSSSPLPSPDFIAAVAKAADLRLPLEVFLPVNGRWRERPLDELVDPGVDVLNSQELLLSPQRAPAPIPSASAVSAASCSILQERAEEAVRQV